MQTISRDIFYEKTSGFAWISFSQTDAYCRAIVPADTLRYYLDNESDPQIGCVGYVKSKWGKKMLVIHGECLKTERINRKIRESFYADLLQTSFDIFELNLDTPYSCEDEIALRKAGWLRPVGMFSTTLSKVIDLQQPFAFRHDWQHNLKKAAQNNLRFRMSDNSEQDIEVFCHLYQDMMQRKHFADIELNATFLRQLLSDKRFVMSFAETEAGEIIAGRIVFAPEHRKAQSLFAASSLQARQTSAAYFLYEQFLLHLSSLGMLTYDMGRLSPATHQKNNLFIFKDGIVGDYVQYQGEWEYCKRSWYSPLLYLFKKHIWKRVRT